MTHVIRYFQALNVVKIKLLDSESVAGEISENLYNHIWSLIKNLGYCWRSSQFLCK